MISTYDFETFWLYNPRFSHILRPIKYHASGVSRAAHGDTDIVITFSKSNFGSPERK